MSVAGEMSVKDEELLQAVEKMPGFPKSVQRVLELTSDINCPQRELVEVIKNDPVFTLKILRMVNSACFSLAQEVTSVNQASVYLGLNTLKNVALGLAAIGTLPMRNKAGFDMKRFWLHSLAAASLTQILARSTVGLHSMNVDFFSAGLLHDIGKVVLALYASDPYREVLRRAQEEKIPLHRLEREAFGLSHADLGARLAENWNLPPELCRAIAGHHSSIAGDALSRCVGTANEMVKYLGYGHAGSYVVEQRLVRPGKDLPQDLPGLAVELGELEPEMEKARLFVQVGSG